MPCTVLFPLSPRRRVPRRRNNPSPVGGPDGGNHGKIGKNRTGRPEATCIRTGGSVEEIKQAILDNLVCVQGRFAPVATRNDYYLAVAYTVRDRILAQWAKTAHTYYEKASRTVCYLSAEFLLGPHLENHLINLGLYDDVQQAVEALGLDFQALIDQEEEPGLGNGGLGRLAACYLDSLATLNIPAIGYGIRYEFGIFTQEIRDGWQEEVADQWLRKGNPWEVARPEIAYDIPFGGHTESGLDDAGRYRVRWVPERRIRGVAYDTMITGYDFPFGHHAAPLSGGGDHLLRSSLVQRRRLLRRRPRQDRLGEPDQGPLSQRRAVRRPSAPADAAVPLRLLRAAGHDPHLFPAGKEPAIDSTRNTPSSSTTPIRRSASPN